jgi:dTDP-4-dehydrorhamnose 3,5-epimerase-like enzyme
MEKFYLLDFPTCSDSRGQLTSLEQNVCVPFEIKRAYYIYNIPGNAVRGNHAHKSLEQIIIAVAGSFEITLDDGKISKSFQMTRANSGLYVGPMVWRSIRNFTENAICLVITSEIYDESDYIHTYSEFVNAIEQLSN